MSNWKGAIQNEWDILWKKKTTKFFVGFTVLVPISLGWLLDKVNLSFGLLPISSSGIPLFTLAILISAYLPLLIFMLVSDGLTFQPQVLKAFFLRPIHRYKLYCARIIAIAGLIAIHLGLALFTSLLSGWMFQEWLGWEAVREAFLAYGLSFLPLLLWITIASFVAQWFRSQTGAMISLILIFTCSYIFLYINPAASAFSPAHYNDWHTLVSAGASATESILYGTSYLFSTGFLFFLIGLVMFERRNI
mgnify:CR=1 FL=1